jgi:hypothetical protein
MDDARTVDTAVLHGGCPVVEGEKWSEEIGKIDFSRVVNTQ